MMLYLLKNFSVRLWLTLLGGGLISLWALPWLQPRIGLDWSLIPAALIMMAIFSGIGWCFNLYGSDRVSRCVREAESWERDGLFAEAEKAFQRAVDVLDSFLISPGRKHRPARRLAARMARFYISRLDRPPSAETFILSYLEMFPQDEEVAEQWIHQLEQRGGMKEEYQEILQRIGAAHARNRTIQFSLARFYLLLERTDYPALQVYRRLFDGKKRLPPAMVDPLARLFAADRRADEWALAVYLDVLKRHPHRKDMLNGLAACLRLMTETERNRPLLVRTRELLKGYAPRDLEVMSDGFRLPAATEPYGVSLPVASSRLRNLKWSDIGRGAADALRSARSAAGHFLGVPLSLLHRSRRARQVLVGVFSGLLLVLGIWLGFNTFSHLFEPQSPETFEKLPAAEVVTDPFTLQVAAYLKAAYAKSYVQELTSKGLDAYWTEVDSGGKRWYQVRISHFPDKQSARELGKSLKAQGIIEDYYVANYRRPG
jgi:hypothetical protein